MKRALALLILAIPVTALGAERFAVIAVGDPPGGPDGDLTELTYQLRAACRDRVPNVLDPSDMRGRLLGRTSSANESELDRAYGGALTVYQNGEFDSSLRTLRAIVDDLESLPETEESYFQWKRANLRLALSAMAANDPREVEGAFGKVIRMEPALQPDPDQFSPGFRKRFEEARAKIRALPRRKLTVTAEGRQGTVYVNGKSVGQTPLTVTLPAGVYRVGGGAGTLRVPSFRVDLEQEDRTVVLDFALAEALRMNAGPGLALAPGARGNGVVRAGAWLGVDKLVVVSRAEEGQAQFLVGSIYDVLRGALLREGSVRMVAGGVPSVNLAALSGFLLNGQASREVKELSRDAVKHSPPPVAAEPQPPTPAAQPPPAVAARAVSPPPPVAGPVAPARMAPASAPIPAAPIASPTALVANPAAPVAVAPRLDLLVKPAVQPASTAQLAEAPPPPAPPHRRAWRRPVTIGAGILAVGLAGLALQQSSSANRSYSRANDQLTPAHAYRDAESQARYGALRSDGDRARTNATVAAAGAAVCAVTAIIVGWKAWSAAPEPAAGVRVEF